MKYLNQVNFTSLLFDTLFGLILFFGLDSFLEIKTLLHFFLYLFTTMVLIHWWIMYKASDDAFGEEVTDSIGDLMIGIFELFLLNYLILSARIFAVRETIGFMVLLLLVDSTWALLWRYVGSWQTKSKKKVASMEAELDQTIKINLTSLVFFCALYLLSVYLNNYINVILFVIFYLLNAIATVRSKLIDIRLF